MEDVTATMSAGQAKVRGIENVAEGAAHGLAEIATAVELVEQAAARVRVTAQSNRETTAQLQGQAQRSEEHTSELQSLAYLVCRLLLEKKKKIKKNDLDKAVADKLSS